MASSFFGERLFRSQKTRARPRTSGDESGAAAPAPPSKSAGSVAFGWRRAGWIVCMRVPIVSKGRGSLRRVGRRASAVRARLVAGAGHHRERRISGKPRIRLRPLAEIESRAAIADDDAAVSAGEAEPD